MITFEYTTGRDGKHYWRARSSNGMIVADGGEGYSTRQNARRAARRFRHAIAYGRWVDE